MSLFSRKPKVTPAAAPQYACCERVTATGSSPFHIRELSAAGMFTGGGADTLALCGATVAWDTSATTLQRVVDGLPNQHESFRYCDGCVAVVLSKVGA